MWGKVAIRNQLVKSAAAALCLHVLLIAYPLFSWNSRLNSNLATKAITVKLQKYDVDEKQLEQNLADEVEVPSSTVTPPAVFPIKSKARPSTDNKIVEQPPHKPIPSSAVNAFVERSTQSYFESNPHVLDRLDSTFEFKQRQRDEVISLDSAEAKIDAFRNGVGKTVSKSGKHVCYAVIYDLASGSAGIGDQIVGKDCTPQEKFSLNIDQPDNGYATR